MRVEFPGIQVMRSTIILVQRMSIILQCMKLCWSVHSSLALAAINGDDEPYIIVSLSIFTFVCIYVCMWILQPKQSRGASID